jgi:hypothetical protein
MAQRSGSARAEINSFKWTFPFSVAVISAVISEPRPLKTTTRDPTPNLKTPMQ